MLLLNLIIYFLHGTSLGYSAYKIFLNYSLLLGFIKPSASITTGGWFIGNEIVFCFILPFIFLISNKWKYIIPISFLVSIACGFYWSFFLLDKDVILYEQWSLYVNPFNHIYFFMAGVLICVYGPGLSEIISKRLCYAMLFFALMLFWLYPSSGNKIQIVTGVNRTILSACCILFVVSVFLTNPKLNSLFGKPLSYLGEISYSIYLLHPIVPYPILFFLHRLNVEKYAAISYFLSFFLTFIVSWFTFNYLEKPMMKIGRDLSKKVKMS
jgi:peptidoglycan/LPS O-acetylase OafA/YrhL